MGQNKSPNCYQCKYYFVTWDKKTPHGCKAMGFKGKMIPSREVFMTTGEECHYFRDKNPKPPSHVVEEAPRPNSSFTFEA